MNKTTKVITWIIIVLVVAWGIWYGINRKPKEATGETIKIGFVGSLTGGLETWGVESKNSIALAVNEINKNGGIDGRPLEIVYEDGKCDAATAVSAAQKLISVDRVNLIIGFCAQEVLSIAPIAEKNKIILFAPAATSPNITNINDYTFRLAPSDNQPAEKLAKLISERYEQLAIISEANEFPQAFRGYIVDALNKTEKNMVFDESFNSNERDFRSLILKMKQNNPDVVIINANTPIAEGLIVKQMKELGLKLPSYGLYLGRDYEFINTAGIASDGFMFYDFIVDDSNPRIQDFLDKYKNTYGSEAPHPQFAILSYEAPYIIKQAISAVGYNSKNLKDYFRRALFEGLSGDIKFGKGGDASGAEFNLFQVMNGEVFLYEK